LRNRDQDITGYFTPQVSLFHVSDAIYLIENLKPLRRADRPTHILTCIAKFLCCDIVAFAKLSKNMNEKLNTLWFEEMVRLFVRDTGRPPRRLGHFWISAPLASRARRRPSPIVWIVDLFPWLDKLDKCLGNDSAVQLLKGVKCLFIILLQAGFIVNSNNTCRRGR
jgi:hypothetical protein